MQKNKLLTCFLLLAATFSAFANEKERVNIKGEAVGLSGPKKIYLQRYYNKMFFVIDSSVIKDGRFSFRTKLEIPELYGLTIDTSDISPLFLFIDTPNEVFVKYDTARGGRNTVITGSAAADRYKLYQQTSRNIKIDEFIKEQPSSIVAAWVLYRYYSSGISPEQIEEYTNLLDKSLANTQYVKLLRALPATLRERSIGSPAPDFTLNDPEGKPVKLSDNFGKYLLVDFWAAWCVPCRRENPNVVKVYNKYKDKGFGVFGVSLDSRKEAWVKAIQQDGLTWPQVSDLLFWDSEPAKLYGIRTIPGNVLLDPSGKIIARNLRGEDLEKKIAELLP